MENDGRKTCHFRRIKTSFTKIVGIFYVVSIFWTLKIYPVRIPSIYLYVYRNKSLLKTKHLYMTRQRRHRFRYTFHNVLVHSPEVLRVQVLLPSSTVPSPSSDF